MSERKSETWWVGNQGLTRIQKGHPVRIGREKGSLCSNPIIISFPKPGDPLPGERWMHRGYGEVEITGPALPSDTVPAQVVSSNQQEWCGISYLTPIPPKKRLRVKLSKDQYIEVDADDVEEIEG